MCFRAQVAVSSAVPADMILSSAWFLLERQRETPKPTLFIIPAVQQEVKPKFADYLIYILFSLVFSPFYSFSLWFSFLKSYYCWFFSRTPVESCLFWRKSFQPSKNRMIIGFFCRYIPHFLLPPAKIFQFFRVFFYEKSSISPIICYNDIVYSYY